MLRQLIICDLAVIASADLEFAQGMSVFTGETGAGKSILMGALGLILGDRADTDLIRGGASKAEVAAVVDIGTSKTITERLTALHIEHEQELYLRRIISEDGRSRAYINNTPVPVQCLRELGELLVDLHGQHAHQSLLRHETQRKLVDDFGAHQPLLADLHAAYQRWHSAAAQLKELSDDSGNHQDQLNLIRYQLDELEALELTEASYSDLVKRHQSLANAHDILDSTQAALDQISEGEDALLARIVQLQNTLSKISGHSDTAQSVEALLNSAGIQLDEARSELRHLRDTVEINPQQLQQIEASLDRYHSIARKHKLHPQELYSHQQTLSERLSQLEENTALVKTLTDERDQALQHYYTLAEQLHQARALAATRFATKISEKMQEVGMPDGRFHIMVTHDADADADAAPLPDGLDRIEFQVTTNPGQPFRILNKVASGGELSRISLVIRIIGTKESDVPVMVFDEVDAGIGGNTAVVVGQLLRRLAQHRQVLCITHLAQVASFGQHHYRVDKTTRNKQTYTHVCRLKQSDRVDEIARMLGGKEITEQSRRHAQEILNN